MRETSERTTHKIAQGYHLPTFLQRTRLAHAVRPRGMEDGAPPHGPGLQFYLIESGAKGEKERFWGMGI